VPGPNQLARLRALARQPGLKLTVACPPALAKELSTENPNGADSFSLVTLEECRNPTLLRNFDALLLAGVSARLERTLLRLAPGTCRRVMFFEQVAHSGCGFVKETLLRRRLARYDAAVAAGRLAERRLRALGFARNRVEIVGNVVDPTSFEKARSEKDSYPGRAGSIVFEGSMTAGKNLSALLEGYRMARTGMPEMPDLVLAGEGPEAEALRRQAQTPGLKGRVHLMGTLPPRGFGALLAGCAFAVLPSRHESWGLLVNKAFHAGRPILASMACGCLPELLVPSASWLLRGFEPSDMAEGLVRACRESHRWDAMGEAGRRLVEERFTPHAYAERVAQALRRSL